MKKYPTEAEAKAARYASRARAQLKRRDNGKQRAAHLRAKYGITPEDEARMLADQEGRCAICRGTSFGRYGTPRVDHDHGPTKHVRGLLCDRCNVGLGKFNDSATTLLAAVRYLNGDRLVGVSAGLLF